MPRVVDYVIVVNAGDSSFKVGDYAEKSEMEKVNADLKERRKKPVEIEPFSFYLSAWEEDRHTIAQANIETRRQGAVSPASWSMLVKLATSVLVNRDEVDYVDVSPKQLVSVAASLVPFLEHDDANRALMGANMQRQSVPLLRAQAPIVGNRHGRRYCARLWRCHSGEAQRHHRFGRFRTHHCFASKANIIRCSFRVKWAAIFISSRSSSVSNQNTCINQKPIVKKGQRVVKGQVIADGPCTDFGELALGRNVLVAFMPWRGYNFEDAILVSEKDGEGGLLHLRPHRRVLNSKRVTRSLARKKSRVIFRTSANPHCAIWTKQG